MWTYFLKSPPGAFLDLGSLIFIFIVHTFINNKIIGEFFFSFFGFVSKVV